MSNKGEGMKYGVVVGIKSITHVILSHENNV